MTDIVPAGVIEKVNQKIRSEIPKEHCVTDDARIMWLWNQRLIVIQSIYLRTTDIRTKMCARLILDAAWSSNLPSIELLLRRLEGGAVQDKVVQEGETLVL